MRRAFNHRRQPSAFHPFIVFFHFTILSISLLSFSSCSAPDGRFRLEGRFKNLNQGEFYLYCFDKGTKDTIAVKEGRFVYDVPLEDTLTLTMLFPNFSELPIFAQPGTKVQMTGDATHLKETEIKGTKQNDEMTAFRLKANQLTPPEVTKEAEQFIVSHPTSPISQYLLQRYFIVCPTPDYAKARLLCDTIVKASPGNTRLQRLQSRLALLKNTGDTKSLPTFSATDMQGQRVDNNSLKAEVNVIHVWATWNYDSQYMLRQLQKLKKDNPTRLSIVTISLDASPKEAQKTLDRDSIRWSNVCDGQMWQMPVLSQLGITCIPANIVSDKSGKILARNLANTELRKKLDELLKQ